MHHQYSHCYRTQKIIQEKAKQIMKTAVENQVIYKELKHNQ